MSECVVRMKKYGNCLDCDLHQTVYGDSYADTDVYCFKEKRFVRKRFGPIKDLARPSWCPIICQLPEGHGRLVDKDEMLKKIENYHRYMTVGREKERNMIDLIDRQAAIVEIAKLEKIVPYYFRGEMPSEAHFNAGLIAAIGIIQSQPTASPWHRVEEPPEPHKDVLVTGMEAINNSRVYKVMVNDNGTWRPTDYAPSIRWDYWMPIEPPKEDAWSKGERTCLMTNKKQKPDLSEMPDAY